MQVRWARALITTLLTALTAACSSPGGGPNVIGGDTSTIDGVLFPDAALPDTVAPEDTARVDADTPDTATPVDTAAPVDTAGPACVEGAACDDFDACTVNDQCAGGVCRGTALDCDDDVPCTVDTCLGGRCQHAMQAGFCRVDGACWTNGQYNPQNDCLKCLSATSESAWSSDDGRKCDDGDACTTGEVCGAGGVCGGGVTPREICDDQIDNDCDGKTDGDDPACGGVETCAYHTDCYPERLCATWATTGLAVCSDPCIGAADCDPGQICTKLPGSAQVGFCQAPPPGGLADGSPCTLDGECASLLCADDVCRPTCLAESRCPGADTCHPVGDLGLGFVTAACAPNGAGLRPIGQICSDASGMSFDSAYCASGHCDLMPYPSEQLYCQRLCNSESACDPAQECNVVLYAATENAAAMPFDPLYTVLSHDALTACYTPKVSGGSLPDGSPCTPQNHAQCASNKCFLLSPGDPQAYCTTYCEFDAECASGMACKAELVTLASDWLQNPIVNPPGRTPYPATTALRTLIRVCKWL